MIMSGIGRISSSRKSKQTPIKTLIAQEMLKEVESKRTPPNVVAKLMGLDALPHQQLNSASQRSHSRSHSDTSFGYWQQEHGLSGPQEHDKIHRYPTQNDYKDVYDIWQSHNNCVGDKLPRNGRFNGNITADRKMALVRQNFVELKRLATDEKLRQSKQFQDALEVLRSNRDSFLKFLQEPNSMLSHNLYDLQSTAPPSETKRITVLRPAKMVDNIKNSRFGQINSTPELFPQKISKLEDTHTQATRIVVLKPSPRKSHDLNSELHVEDSNVGHGDDDARESREMAKEITRQMRENLSGQRRDETLISSVFSNGYIGDESSFHKTENEYAVEILSDSEGMSPISQHSWDYINRFGIPYSLSSSRASYSPDSSVCREAKKRLSERWAMMASNGNGSCQEPRHTRRNSGTLGEMLALSDMKKSVAPEKDQESRASTSCLTGDSNDKDKCDTTPNLLRSKSLPVSSMAYGSTITLEGSDPKMEKTDVTKGLTKSRSVKLSLKGKVSSLFFSRSKKSTKDKSSQSRDETESAGIPPHSPENVIDKSEYGNDMGFKVGLLPDPQGGSSSTASSLDSLGMGAKHGIIPTKAGFSLTKPCTNRNLNENQEQPSPISVLEPPFEEDGHRAPAFFNNFKPYANGLEQPMCPNKSNLIDKSPPIGSIARTLSWDDYESCSETASPYPLKSSAGPIGAEEERQECFFYVQALLSEAGIDSEVKSDTFLGRWHSLESPLDPSLRDKFIDLKETLHEGKRRQRRSTQKLVFDCVNAALVDIAGYGSNTCQRAILCSSGPHDGLKDPALPIMDTVWAQMEELFCGELRCVLGVGGDHYSLAMERVVRKEVVGKGWVEHLSLETDNFRKEIEGKLLEELVQEAVEEFLGRI